MYVNIFAVFVEPFSSHNLYDEIKEYNVHVTDLIECTYAYGNILITDLERVIYIFLKFGVTRITFTITKDPSK